jgi:hypothetical protein
MSIEPHVASTKKKFRAGRIKELRLLGKMLRQQRFFPNMWKFLSLSIRVRGGPWHDATAVV